MKKPRHWWLAKSVSDDDDTMTAYDIDGDDEDWMATKGIYVVEKSTADKLAEALEDVIRVGSKESVQNACLILKQFRGEV